METKVKEIKIDKEAIIKVFREKLASNGQSLKWWHNTYIPEMYEYNYFIRQINTPGSIKPDLLEALRDYISIPI